MVGKVSKKTLFKVCALMAIIIMIIALLVGNIFSANSDKYVVIVKKAEATNKDDNLKITENIVKGEGEQSFDSRSFDYEVKVENIAEKNDVETQVAMVLDTSYSMDVNDINTVVRSTAKELAIDILNNVKNSKVSISNNSSTQVSMTNGNLQQSVNAVNTAFANNLITGDGIDSNVGLKNAVESFSETNSAVNKYIIVLTDSTDDVLEKMNSIKSDNPDVKVISILVDMTSNSYILTDGSAVNGDVFVLLSENTADSITNVKSNRIIDPNNKDEDEKIIDLKKIYNEMNKTVRDIKVTNTFSEGILKYFDITYNTEESNGTVTLTKDENGKNNGYVWNAGTLNKGEVSTLKFNLTLRVKDVDKDILFHELNTNEKQDVEYKAGESEDKIDLEGTDARTESTIIKVVKGYDIRIRAVNQADTNSGIEGIGFIVIGTKINDDGTSEVIYKSNELKTDKNGYIKITADEASALREDGRINYEVRPVVNKVGYASTNSAFFDIINDKKEGHLTCDTNGNENFIPVIDEPNRLVTITMPIESQKFDFEVKVHELNNTNVTISDSTFQLIQPKFNNKYELSVLEDTTNGDGTIHFAPTVMQKDGKYEYMLRQVGTQDGYNVAQVAVINVTFENGKVVETSVNKRYNADVTADLCTDKENHVLVTVPNENLKEDPFDLQINVEDKFDGTKLDGVSYIVTTSVKGQERKEIVKTVDGQINTKIYGNGVMSITIAEQLPAVGYKQDALIKEVIIDRINNVVYIRNQTNLDYTNSVTVSNKTDNVGTNNDQDEVIVNLYREKKKEQNILRVKVVDAGEQDVQVGEGVVYTLTDENGEKYPGVSTTSNRVASNKQGELAFTLNEMSQGTHEYTLSVDPNTIPSEYDDTQILKDIRVRISFDEHGHILEGANGVSVIDDQNLLDQDASMQVKDESVEHTAFIKLGYPLNEDNTAEFVVKLLDDETKGPISRAKYSLEIKWDVNVDGNIIERTKNIEGRYTNDNGQIVTRITRASEVRVTVTEIEAKPGYNRDMQAQDIVLKFDSNGRIRIDSQWPYGENDQLGPDDQGAFIDSVNGKERIVYQHLNRKRSSEDTYLNLTLNVVDREYSPTTGFTHVSGVWLKVTSNTLLDENGAPLEFIMRTGDQGSDGEVTVDYEKYINNTEGYTHTIRVPGIGEDIERAVYEMSICEVDLDENGQFKEKVGTLTTYKMAYTYKNGRVSLNQVECDYGNRLIANTPGTIDGKYFSNYSDDDQGTQQEDTMGVFLGNINLRLYTNYDDIGNLAVDLKKQNQNEEPLKGAQYALRVTNPDGTMIRKNIVIGNDETDIELAGLSVNVGSRIELTENVAPIGYVENDTEIFEVTGIDAEGEITLEHINDSYNPTRVKLESNTEMTSSGLKTFYEIIFIDYSLDTFEFGITTKDVNTQNGVEGYGFTIDTTKGAKSSLTTGSDGTGKTKVGGSIESDTITYTITSVKTADYYKPLVDPIKVIVAFDENGRIDVSRMTDSTKPDYVQQTDAGYGTLWKITELEANEHGRIGITINVDHQDPLVVNVKTLDSITKATVAQVEYKVEPSQILEATGSNRIEVGFITQNATIKYKLTQTSIKPSYAAVESEEFTVTYLNGKITGASLINDKTTSEISDNKDKEVTITIYVEPKVPFEITNLYFFDHDIKLQGANFEVISQRNQDKGAGTTDANGKTPAIYSDILGKEEDVLYKIRQTKAADGYATVDDFYILVTYDGTRKITSAKLTDAYGVEVTNNRFVQNDNIKVDYNNNRCNFNDNGIVTIDVYNYPEFKILIKDVDRRDGTTPIVGTTYSVTSTYDDEFGNKVDFTKTSNPAITDATGLGTAHLDKTRDNTVVTYTVKEDSPAVNYQSLGTDIKVRVTFDENGYVSKVDVEDDDNLSKIEHASKVDPITDDRDRFIVNLELRNNPILKINIDKVDRDNKDTKVDGVGFTIVGKDEDGNVYTNSSSTNKVNQSETPETSILTGVTGVSGYTAMYLDRTLDNKDMYYTIKEVVKAPGYNWTGEDIVLKVTYNSDGQISVEPAPQQGTNQVKIKSFNANDFTIDLQIYNDEVEKFGIHLSAIDTYDADKKLDNMKVEAFLVEPGNNSYVSDGKYELVGDNALLTGADRDNDGKPDCALGEDYGVMGEYTEGKEEWRTLRLVIKNDSKALANNNGYYLDSADGSKSGSNIGYDNGTAYFDDAKYQTVKYQYLIDVLFTDEGKIKEAKLRTGLDGNIGWLTDERYIEVFDEALHLTHTDYKLNVTMKFFPMLDLKLNAMDNYTGEDEANKNGLPIALDGTKYTVSTMRHLVGQGPTRDEFVRAGYIGYRKNCHYNDTIDGDTYEDTDELLVPIENNYTRLFYVYEQSEPDNYQKYTDRYLQYEIQKLVAIIQVTFDEKGHINYDESIVRKVDGNLIHPYMAEDGTTYLSSNNLKEYNYYYAHKNARRDIDFYIGYSLTTKINVTAVDDITETDPISNIRMYPFINNESYPQDPYNDICLTNTSYEYNTIGYRNTDIDGKFSIEYWGAAATNNVNQYVIGSSRQGNDYNGYLFPSDMASMASEILGQPGNESDYYAKLDVQYDDNGKISSVTTVGADLWGDDNVATDITWDPMTGNINIKMLYSRKFQVALYKKDLYDSNIDKLGARFSVTWRDPETNGESRVYINSITANDMKAEYLTTLGKVYKGKNVKYTLSEEIVPYGYNQIEGTLDFWVNFSDNGDIGMNSISPDRSSEELYKKHFELVGTSTTTKEANKKKPDLTINLKDEPAFMLDLRVIDEFYKADGISDIQLEITNDKDTDVCVNTVTDPNGWANGLKVGKVYPKETVIYTIKQKNDKDPDYYRNDTVIKLRVSFDERGRIKPHYEITNGDRAVNKDTFDLTKFENSRSISMEIMNRPKALKIGLKKYDQLDDQPMGDVKFSVTKAIIQSDGSEKQEFVKELDLTDSTTGTIVQQVDTFMSEDSAKAQTVKYTIHEVNVAPTYRKMQDAVILVEYNAYGKISSSRKGANSDGTTNDDVERFAAIDKILHLKTSAEVDKSERVHLLVNAPNDNAYDVIIKNEDANFAGLGIENSEFAVSIKGKEYKPELTDSNGVTSITKLTQSGNIEINISQKTVGDGYRFDQDNVASINVDKGTGEYSLKLNPTMGGYIDDANATLPKAVVKVDEEHGTITVTFKNETKVELTIVKQDVDSKAVLEGAKFKVTAQEVDTNGDPVQETDPIELQTKDGNYVTNSDGQLYFDIGKAPAGEGTKIWKYTIKEEEQPINPETREKYNPIIDLVLTVTYDQYGKIMNMTSNSRGRMVPIIEHSDDANCRSIKAIVYNGDISPAYKLTIYTVDAETGRKISGSQIHTEITDDNGKFITVNPKTSASSSNGQTAETKNLGINGIMYTDAELEALRKANSAVPTIQDLGLIYIDNIDYQGILNINVDQLKTAPGYIFGDQKTSTGTTPIKIKATYEPHLGEDPTVDFEILDNAGFGNDLVVDDVNREIILTIKNESQVTFDILTLQYGSEKPISPATNYTISAEIQTLTSSTPIRPLEGTDDFVTTPLTDDKGKTSRTAGSAQPGKTVLYTIHQNTPLQYKQIEDIKIEVHYDSRGNIIQYPEMLTSEDNAYIKEEETGGRKISLVVQNRKDIKGYKVNIEKHAMDTDDDPYAYDTTLPGAIFNVKVEEKDGDGGEWTEVTDADGLIKGPSLTGTGKIKVTAIETYAPAGYTTPIEENNKYWFEGYRDPSTGEFDDDTDKNVNIEITDPDHLDDDGNLILTLKPLNRQESDKFTVILNKRSNTTNKNITENPAKFKVELYKKNETGDGNLYYDLLEEEAQTNERGKLTLDNLKMPTESGEYTLAITELEAPEGYKKLADKVEIPVTFEKDADGNMIITKVNIDADGLEHVNPSKIDRQLIGLFIGNDADDELKDDEYQLDITKIDAETGEPIEEMAIFKVELPDDQHTSVYTETMETPLGLGKLDYCYIEQNRDYELRLTHMKKPTEPTTLTYKFWEARPPQGYTEIEDELLLTIEFDYDDNGELTITKATSSNENYLKVRTDETPYPTMKLKVDILNNVANKNEFTIHYDANDNGAGTTVPADQTKYKGQALVLSTDEPTRDGLFFGGWTTDPTSTVAEYQPGDTFNRDEDTTLYAVWEEKLYLRSEEYQIVNAELVPLGDEIFGEVQVKYDTEQQFEYNEGDKFIIGIIPQIGELLGEDIEEPEKEGTTVEKLIANLEHNADNVKVYKKVWNENKTQIIEEEAGKDDLVGTAMRIELKKGTKQKISLELSVVGDVMTSNNMKMTVEGQQIVINGDGVLRHNDQNLIKKQGDSHADIVRNSGMVFVVSLDIDLDGQLDHRNANLSLKIIPQENTDLLREILPWKK